MTAPKVRYLTIEEIGSGARLMAEAYQNDPSVPRFIGSQHGTDERLQLLERYFSELLRLGVQYGHVAATDFEGNLAGLIIFYGPGQFPLSHVATVLSGVRLFLKIGRAVGLKTFIRLLRLATRLAEAHPKEPHYYAEIGCVSSKAQKHGLGKTMTDHIFALADTNKLGVYGETSNENNFPIMKKLGYQVVGETVIDGSMYWSLWRPPRSNDKGFK